MHQSRLEFPDEHCMMKDHVVNVFDTQRTTMYSKSLPNFTVLKLSILRHLVGNTKHLHSCCFNDWSKRIARRLRVREGKKYFPGESSRQPRRRVRYLTFGSSDSQATCHEKYSIRDERGSRQPQAISYEGINFL